MYSAVSAIMRFEDQAISRVLVVTEMYDYLYASGETVQILYFLVNN